MGARSSSEALRGLWDELEAAAPIQHAYGRWLKRQGDDRAEEWLEAARRTFKRCGAAIDLMGVERA